MSQMKEEDKSPEKQLNEMEVGNLPKWMKTMCATQVLENDFSFHKTFVPCVYVCVCVCVCVYTVDCNKKYVTTGYGQKQLKKIL